MERFAREAINRGLTKISDVDHVDFRQIEQCVTISTLYEKFLQQLTSQQVDNSTHVSN